MLFTSPDKNAILSLSYWA